MLPTSRYAPGSVKARVLPAHPPRQQRLATRRKRLAGFACALWLVGFDLAPTAHIALHAHLAEHDHGHGVSHTHSAAREPAQPAAHGHVHTHDHAHAVAPHPAPRAARSFSAWRDHGAEQPEPSKRYAQHFAHVASTSAAQQAEASHAHPHASVPSTTGADRGEAGEHDNANDRASQGESPLDHGEGSLAHRDLAALLPLPGLPPVPEAPFMGWLPATTHRELAGTPRPTATRARAPPAHTDIRHFT